VIRIHLSRRQQTWARDGAALLIIALIGLIFTWRLFTPMQADRVQLAGGDFTQQFLAFRRFGLSELQQSRWPLWMPCVDSGYPYFADPQAASFYPPALVNFALQLLSGAPEFSLQALQWEAVLHILLAACLTYLFLRSEVRSRIAAVIGSVTFAFGGYLTSYPVLQLAILESAAWLPLALWAARRLAVQKNRRSVVWLALPLALSVLAGHPQTYTLIWYLTGAYFLYCVWRNQSGWRKSIVRFSLAVVLALMLSAIQLLPSFEFMRLSTRTDLPYTVAGTGFPLADIWQMIVPGVVSHFSPLYIGLLPLALAVFAIGGYVINRKAMDRSVPWRDVPWWSFIALIGLLLSFGSNLALFDGFYWLMPGYRVFHNQERSALVISWALAVLAAYGTDAVMHSLSRRQRAWLRREIRWLIGLLVLVGIAAAAQTYLSASGGARVSADQLTLAFVFLALTVTVFVLRAYRSVREPWLAILLLGVVALDVITIDRGVNWVPPYDPFPAQPALQAIRQDTDGRQPFRLHNEQRLPGSVACLAGFEELGGVTPIHLNSYQDFVQQVPREVRWQLLNVKYVVTWRSVLDDHLGRPVDATLLAQQGEGKDAVYTYRLNENYPRAWLVHQIEVPPERSAIYVALAAPDFDPRQVAYVSTSIAVDPAQADEPVSIVTALPDRLVLAATPTTAGVLVMSEVNYPGWTATVNGQPVPIEEVDGLLSGVTLPAGQTRVELTFRPVLVLIGLALSIVGLTVCFLMVLMNHVRLKRND
jgi:uncharacterized membrane protein YfhO